MTLLSALLLATLLQARGNWPTLAAELADRGVPLPAGVDGTKRITSFSEFDDDNWFVIGYSDVRPDDTLRVLNVRAFNRRARRWRSARFDEIGSVLSVTHAGRSIYVTGHSSPSSSPLLVLREDLTLKRELEGWVKWTSDDGRVIFERGMRHFAPSHAGVLAIYDPATNRDVTFYPAGRHNDSGLEDVPGTDLRVDRDIGEVQAGKRRRTIAFHVSVQEIGLVSDQHGDPAGPETHLLVTCDLTRRIPTCSERPTAAPERR